MMFRVSLVLASLWMSVLASALPETSFLFFGDFGTGSAAQKEVAEGMQRFCGRNSCQFTLLLGDNFYPVGVTSVDDPQWESKFLKYYSDLPGPFYPALGNHDYGGNVQAQIQFSSKWPRWILPHRYHAFSRDEIDFLVIDTNNFDQAQRTWLTERLAASRARWKIVYGHHPIYSYGEHGNTPGLAGSLLPILQRGQVDFYLCGHDHDKQVLNPQGGVNLVVSGTAAQTRRVTKGPMSRFAADSLGFSYMRVVGDRATLQMLKKDGAVEFEAEYVKPALTPPATGR